MRAWVFCPVVMRHKCKESIIVSTTRSAAAKIEPHSREAISRRDFLTRAAGAMGLGTLASCGDNGNVRTRNISSVLDKYDLKDQYGKPFNTPDMLKGKPYLLVFGYESCPFCEGRISKNLAAIQQEVGFDVPIVVVSIHPEADYENRADYINKYREIGVRQYRHEDLGGDASKAYESGGKDMFYPSQRSLHVLFAPNDDVAAQIHSDCGRPKIKEGGAGQISHTPLITLCDKDGQQRGVFMAGEEVTPEGTAILIRDIKKALQGIERGK